MSNGKVETTIKNGIATVQFMHPQSNSLPGTLLMSLAGEIEKAGNNNDAKVIVLKSEGEKTFCAGASFDELKSIRDAASGKEFFMGFARVILAMIRGRGLGGGVAARTVATIARSIVRPAAD